MAWNDFVVESIRLSYCTIFIIIYLISFSFFLILLYLHCRWNYSIYTENTMIAKKNIFNELFFNIREWVTFLSLFFFSISFPITNHYYTKMKQEKVLVNHFLYFFFFFPRNNFHKRSKNSFVCLSFLLHVQL